MKIKFKVILLLISVIIAATLPLSIFILQNQEKAMVRNLVQQGNTLSNIFARLTHNILLQNEGNIAAARVDAFDILSIIKSSSGAGLIYVDSIVLSSREQFNGLILTRYQNPDFNLAGFFKQKKLSARELKKLSMQKGFSQVVLPGKKEFLYQFISSSKEDLKKSLTMARFYFSRELVLLPVKKMRDLTFIATISAMVVVSLMGFFGSTLISGPISNLTNAVIRFRTGEPDYQARIETKDELRDLALAFNSMTEIIRQKIEELSNTNRELKRLDALKDEFLANVSHELRTPLYGIMGLSETLLALFPEEKDSKTKHNLKLIIQESHRLSRMVNEILDFSQLEHKDITLDFSRVDLEAVIEGAIAILRPLFKDKSLLIKNLIPGHTMYVKGDENKIYQVMLNLLANALKFTEKGEIAVSAEEHGDFIFIHVSDTGIGIPEDKTEIIFQSFVQVDGSTTRQFGGTGLGLAIAKKIIELHGGTIQVKSRLNQGSTFSFSLKKAQPGEIPNTEKEYQGPDPVEMTLEYAEKIYNINMPDSLGKKISKRILAVDDDPVILQIIVDHLSLEGYRVKPLANGSEAIRIIEGDERFDLILLDVMLPNISGYDVCRKIRNKFAIHELLVIMLTAKNKPGDLLTGFEAGANDYITKPVDKKELIARVNNLVYLKKSIEEHEELSKLNIELAIATEIQKTILPVSVPQSKNLDIALHYEAMNQIGGDYYNFQKFNEKELSIIYADASGHGIPAAILCAMLGVSYTFHIAEYKRPDLLLEQINHSLENFKLNQFITACFVHLDLHKMKLYYSSAGQRPPMVLKKKSGKLIQENLFGKPLGFFEKVKYETREVALEYGDRIILITDGVTDVKNHKNENFGIEKFIELIHDHSDKNGRDFISLTIATLLNWSFKTKLESFDDDLTLIVIDVKNPENT